MADGPAGAAGAGSHALESPTRLRCAAAALADGAADGAAHAVRQRAVLGRCAAGRGRSHEAGSRVRGPGLGGGAVSVPVCKATRHVGGAVRCAEWLSPQLPLLLLVLQNCSRLRSLHLVGCDLRAGALRCADSIAHIGALDLRDNGNLFNEYNATTGAVSCVSLDTSASRLRVRWGDLAAAQAVKAQQAQLRAGAGGDGRHRWRRRLPPLARPDETKFPVESTHSVTTLSRTTRRARLIHRVPFGSNTSDREVLVLPAPTGRPRSLG